MHAPNRSTRLMRNERYSIIISSQTDARKKASAFSFTRSKLIVLFCIVVLLLLACVVFAVKSAGDAVSYSNELKALEQSLEIKECDELPAE